MKQRYFTLPFLCLLILACFYYFSQKKDSLLLDRQIVDAVHIPNVNPLFEKADAAKYAQDYQKADIEFRNLLKTPLSTADSQYVLNQLAFINLTTDEDSIADFYLKKIETLYPLSIEAEADYFYNIGTWSSHTFKPKMANDYLQRALGFYKKIYGDKHLKTALCLTQLGLMHYQFGKNFMDSTKLYLSLADTIFQSNVSVHSFSEECAYGLSNIEYIKWDNEQSLLHINQSLSLLEEKHREKEILYALCLSWKSVVIRKEGSMHPEKKAIYFHQMDSLIEKAVEIGKKTSSYKLQKIYADNIRMKSSDKDSVTCAYYFEQLNQLLKTQPDYYGKINRLKGYYYQRMSDSLNSKNYYCQFWNSSIEDTCKNSILLSETSYNLFNYYNALSHFDSALYFLKQNVMVLTEEQGRDVSLSYLLSPYFYEKYKINILYYPLIANIFNAKYETKKDLKALTQAYHIMKLFDSLLFDVLVSSNDETLLSYQKESGASNYASALKIAYSLYKETHKFEYLEFGFKLSERFKSQVLFRNLNNGKTDSRLKPLVDSIQKIKSDIAFLKDKGGQNTVQLKLTNELEQLYKRLEQQQPDYYKSKILQPSLSLKEVQSVLKPTQLLVNYSVTKDKTYRILISQKDCDFQAFEGSEVLDNNIKKLRALMTTKNNTSPVKEYQSIAYSLYKNLLGNIPPQYNSQKDLIIVTDKNLALLPFEALVESDKGLDSDFNKLPYALYRYQFTYTSSFKIYQSNMARSLPENPKVAAFTYAQSSEELPYSEKEIAILQSIYGQNFNTFIGVKCTKQNFLAQQKNVDILHVALHASSNPTDRSDNKIYFAPKHQSPLTDIELNPIQSTVKLLVLSACQTAEGKIEAGEGTYSLSRSFLQCGIPNVIASLWKIDNASTSDILTTFYTKLASNNNISESLNQAKISYLKTADKQTAHPRYWAGLLIFN